MGGALFARTENLTWRPGERAAAEQVDVEMIHALAAVFSGVEHQAVALGGETLVAGNLRGGPQQVAEQRAITRIGIVQRADVFAGRHEHMHGRLRVKVREGVAQLVFVDRGGGYASVNDFAKEATHNASSVQERESFLPVLFACVYNSERTAKLAGPLRQWQGDQRRHAEQRVVDGASSSPCGRSPERGFSAFRGCFSTALRALVQGQLLDWYVCFFEEECSVCLPLCKQS